MNRTTMLETLFDGASEGLMVADSEGIIQLANPAFWTLFGLDLQNRGGISIGQLLDTENTHQLLANLVERELSGRKKDGNLFPLLLSLVKVVDNGKVYYTGHVHDLSAEKSNANSLAKEQHMGRLKSRLVSMASHEFRSPLSQIQLSASLVERYYQRLDEDKIMGHLKKIRMAVNDMTDTLDDFLSLERIDAGIFQPELRSFDLGILAEEVCTQMQPIAGGLELIYQPGGKEQIIFSDRNLLKHCAINLLSNAIKYSAEPGKIILKTDVSAEGYTLSVSDRGMGIPANEQRKLFEPFFRASNAAEVSGTGLGLHIVQNYVHQLHGQITVKSKENKGTTFNLSFPLLMPQTSAPHI
ncbi:ATP-binding protein [Mucilaginibacter ximonensis]|uniref:histidine kinase n=1 Tax=Mucilaginibacter ximonensis TaxID=538021 RepID=A0ABW5YD34_9SPHI